MFICKPLLFLGIFSLVFCTGGISRADGDCASLVQHKCMTCHFVTHICPKVERNKSSPYWKGIINDMVKAGMVATGEEQEQLARCLSSPDAKVKALCPKP